MSMRTPLARARGLGPAREGAHHWWMQRVSAAALVPLGAWFAWSAVGLAGAGHAAFAAWMARPLPATLLALLMGAGLYHGWLGFRVVVEDYVRGGAARTATLAAGAAVLWLAAAAAGVAILRAGALGA